MANDQERVIECSHGGINKDGEEEMNKPTILEYRHLNVNDAAQVVVDKNAFMDYAAWSEQNPKLASCVEWTVLHQCRQLEHIEEVHLETTPSGYAIAVEFDDGTEVEAYFGNDEVGRLW
jgi:hypothetical protein